MVYWSSYHEDLNFMFGFGKKRGGHESSSEVGPMGQKVGDPCTTKEGGNGVWTKSVHYTADRKMMRRMRAHGRDVEWSCK